MLKILKASAKACGVTNHADLLTTKRDLKTAAAKQIGMLAILNVCKCRASEISRTLGLNMSSVSYSIRHAKEQIGLNDSNARNLQLKMAETLGAIEGNRKVIIEVVCGVAFVRSKPDDVEVEIVTKQ